MSRSASRSARPRAARSRSAGLRSARMNTPAFTVATPSARSTAAGVRRSARITAWRSDTSRLAAGSSTAPAWISPFSSAATSPRSPRLTISTWAILSRERAKSARSHVWAGSPGAATPTRSPASCSTERTVPSREAERSSATGGAAVSAKARRGACVTVRVPKRRIASSEVAARSTCACASASAAPTSARVVLSVTVKPSRVK